MGKLKVNRGVLALLVIVSMFVGWQTSLLIALFVLIFTDLDEFSKNLLVDVMAFLGGISLIQLFVSLLTGGFQLIHTLVTNFIGFINSFSSDFIIATGIERYFFNPITLILSSVDSIVSFVIIVLKLVFVLALLKNKSFDDNGILKMLKSVAKKFIDYVANVNLGNFINNVNQSNMMNNNMNVNNNMNMNNNMSVNNTNNMS